SGPVPAANAGARRRGPGRRERGKLFLSSAEESGAAVRGLRAVLVRALRLRAPWTAFLSGVFGDRQEKGKNQTAGKRARPVRQHRFVAVPVSAAYFLPDAHHRPDGNVCRPALLECPAQHRASDEAAVHRRHLVCEPRTRRLGHRLLFPCPPAPCSWLKKNISV